MSITYECDRCGASGPAKHQQYVPSGWVRVHDHPDWLQFCGWPCLLAYASAKRPS